jgi:DNA excision repair protein ERCC-2
MNLFPFEKIRGGQKELLSDVESALAEGKHLVAHAPTGIGKTVAVVAPCLGYALENGKTVFFLNPKHTQHTIVIDTLKRIKEKHKTDFVAVDIIGKQWTCPHKTSDLDNSEFNEFCSALKKDERCEYYNNVHKSKLSKAAKDAIKEIKENPMHSEEIKEFCTKNNLCPYEVCIEAAKEANIIICDYFHIFSPKVKQAFLSKMNKSLSNSILIIDEAHNLPDRIRSTLSVNLTDYSLGHAAKEANYLERRELGMALEELKGVLKELGRGMKTYEEKYVSRDEFMQQLREHTGLNYSDLADMTKDLSDEVLSLPNRYRSHAKSVARFLEGWSKEDKGYARIFRKEKNPHLTYKCLDPSLSSKEIFSDAHTAILMSGTLLPLNMYTSVLGIEKERVTEREYKSPFPKQNRLSIIVPNVTTQYSKRTDYMYQRYAKIVSDLLRDVPGNAAVFFPSYQLMKEVGICLKEYNLKKPVLVEKQDMEKADRVQLYRSLREEAGGILLGVQAGSMSEGLDYANNLLDMVVIVGLPLETPTLETKALIEYYDFVFERGWDYGYIFPAMNRVLQAAGRCIRSETDKGVIVLMDERFKWKNYSKCFPLDMDFITSEIPEKYVKKFFSK